MPSSDDGEPPRPGTSGTRTAQLASLAEQADLRCLPAPFEEWVIAAELCMLNTTEVQWMHVDVIFG